MPINVNYKTLTTAFQPEQFVESSVQVQDPLDQMPNVWRTKTVINTALVKMEIAYVTLIGLEITVM